MVFAKSLKELRETVAAVMKVLRANNLTLNAQKCELDKTSIKFLGHNLDEHGFHIDEAKVRHIQQFRQPQSVSELRSFLGLASFVSPHIQHFADLTSPLWAVSGKNSWKWGPSQKQAFENVKHKISKCATTLGYFCETDRTVLYTDASPTALGAVLVQVSGTNTPRIISFASKALTETEKRYPQNQREALGAVWAVEHFAYYLLGRHFTLRVDAQGIAFLLNRTREDSKRALTRADGWALRLSPYDYNIECIRGRDNIADTLSRLYEGIDGPFNDDVSPWEIAKLEVKNATFLTDDEVREATSLDEVLCKVVQALGSGEWPVQLKRFKQVAEDLYVKDGLVIKNGCVVIPDKLRHKTLEIAHEGHPLAAKLKSILRERVWWPGMPGDAENWVKACRVCAINGKPEKPTPMERIFAPKAVWETIAIDFNGPYARYGGMYILVLVDYRSRYLIARPTKSTGFEQTKSVLEEVFDRQGFPSVIKSDNGPPFNGDDYKKYCAERGIKTIFSTPLFPQQNGLVENYMKIINKAMSASVTCGTNYNDELQAAVRAHNAAAHSVTKVPPEEIMLGRKIKRGLPLLDREKVHHDEDLLNQRDREAKLDAKHREDKRRSARLCRVKPGDVVIVEKQTRSKGEARFGDKRFTVLEEKNGNLLLADDEGSTLRRHVSQTKVVGEWMDAPPKASENHVTIPAAAPIRPIRERSAPSYLKDFVQIISAEVR